MTSDTLLYLGHSRIVSAFRCGLMLAAAATISACLPSIEGGPERLYTVEEETKLAREIASPTNYERYANASAPEQKRLRNQVIFARMYANDVLFSEYEEKLTRERQDVPFYVQLAQTALTTTGSLVGGAQTKAVLHAVVTGLATTKTSYEKDILIEKTIDVLQKQMRAQRKAIRATMIRNLELPVSRYPLYFALTDLEAYYRAGTITGALNGVSTSVTLQLLEAEQEEAQAVRQMRVLDTARAAPAPEPRLQVVARNPRTPTERISPSFSRRIQRNLCVAEDGDFGGENSQTRNAIKMFQDARRLPITGRIENSSQRNALGTRPARSCEEVGRGHKNAYERYRFADDRSIQALHRLLFAGLLKQQQAKQNKEPPEQLDISKFTQDFARQTRFNDLTREAIEILNQALFNNDSNEITDRMLEISIAS